MMKKLFLFLGLALGINQTTQPISLSNARILAGAIAVGAASGAFCLSASEESERDESKKVSLAQKYTLPALKSAVVGAMAGGLGYWILYGYTPEGTFADFNRIVARIQANPLTQINDDQWVNFFENKMETSGPCACVQRFFDITKLFFNLENEIHRAEDLAQDLRQNLPDGISAQDVEDKIMGINKPSRDGFWKAFAHIKKLFPPNTQCKIKIRF